MSCRSNAMTWSFPVPMYVFRISESFDGGEVAENVRLVIFIKKRGSGASRLAPDKMPSKRSPFRMRIRPCRPCGQRRCQ